MGTETCTCFFTTATVTTGTGAVGTVAVVTGAAGVGTVTTGGRTDDDALFAELVPACQPIAATMLNKAVADVLAVMIFDVRAGIARFR